MFQSDQAQKKLGNPKFFFFAGGRKGDNEALDGGGVMLDASSPSLFFRICSYRIVPNGPHMSCSRCFPKPDEISLPLKLQVPNFCLHIRIADRPRSIV